MKIFPLYLSFSNKKGAQEKNSKHYNTISPQTTCPHRVRHFTILFFYKKLQNDLSTWNFSVNVGFQCLNSALTFLTKNYYLYPYYYRHFTVSWTVLKSEMGLPNFISRANKFFEKAAFYGIGTIFFKQHTITFFQEAQYCFAAKTFLVKRVFFSQ